MTIAKWEIRTYHMLSTFPNYKPRLRNYMNYRAMEVIEELPAF